MGGTDYEYYKRYKFSPKGKGKNKLGKGLYATFKPVREGI